MPSGQRNARFSGDPLPGLSAEAGLRPDVEGAAILLQPDEEHLQAGRRALADPRTAEHLRRTRPRIERLLGLLAHRYGTRHSRYLGTAKAALQAAWTAALVNLNPLGRPWPPDTADQI